MDWDGEGLLEGLDGDEREARSRLLDELHADGVSVDELRRAVAEERLVLMPLERALLAQPRYTVAEAAELSGLDVETLRALRAALGLSIPPEDEPYLGDDDIEAARRFRVYLDSGLPLDEVLGLVRVLSASLGRVAEATRAMFARAFLRAGDSEHDLAMRYHAMAETLLPASVADTEYIVRLHFREFTRHESVSLDERTAGRIPDSQMVAIAFADLVGFTALGEEIDEVALGGVADRLTSLAHERVHQPVRIVKTIGDAVMLVSPDPKALLDVLFDLLDAAEADDGLPPLRAGAAWGPAVARYGDWYGATVNLAARIGSRARPGAILVTDAFGQALGEASESYAWSAAGDKNLRGFSAPVRTWRARRAQ